MELDVIKQQTTWNDAANSINVNFSKIKQALALLEGADAGLNEEELIKFLEENGYATEAYVAAQISSIVGGADSAYDTLLEIQQILQGNEASIGTILDEIAKKASKDELKEVSDKVNDHETRISGLEEKSDMFHFVTDADGTTRIKTEYPLFSTMTIASGGKGEKGEGGGGTGTVMAVEVNGEIYDAEDGIVTLPDYPTKAEYESKMAELDEKDSQHTSGIAENKQEIEVIKPKVEKNVNDIGDLQRVDEDIKKQLADIKKITDKFSYEEDGDILKTGSNLVSLQAVASGGRGEEGSGGDSGSSGTLDGLLDVTIDFGGATKEEEEGQVLAYDAESFEWKNRKTMHRHPQGVASDVWVITHNLNKVPNVKIIEDSTGEQVYGAIKVNDMNKITVSFGGAFSGTAYLD